MKNKKAQAATEFLILVGLILFVTIMFVAGLGSYADKIATAKEESVFDDYGGYLQNEFITASQVKDGYSRELILPDSIRGHEYSISNTNQSIKIISKRSEMEFFYDIPYAQGTLEKGKNRIIKENGSILIK